MSTVVVFHYIFKSRDRLVGGWARREDRERVWGMRDEGVKAGLWVGEKGRKMMSCCSLSS